MTWLKPYCEAWEQRFGGEPAYGHLAKVMGRLELLHDREEVLARWREYVKQSDHLYANASRFSQTYGSWKPKRELKELPNPLNEEG